MAHKDRADRTKRLLLEPVLLFCIISGTCLAALLLCFVFGHGELVSRYFFYNTKDTGMDFFHSIEYVNGNSPYAVFGTLYPPLANLLFAFLLRMVPREFIASWPMSYEECVYRTGSLTDLRLHQSPLLLFVLFVLLCGWFLTHVISAYLRKHSCSYGEAAAFFLLLSYGYLYAIERGNVLILALPAALYFVCNYNHPNPFISELACLSLAISAGLKIYPALFGVLLLLDKRYRQAVRTVAYGVLSVIGPALFFNERLKSIPLWVTTMFTHQIDQTHLQHTGSAFSSILHRVARYLYSFLGIEISNEWFVYADILVCVILLLCAAAVKKKWQAVLCVCLAMVLVHSQGAYIYSFFVLPLVVFFAEEMQLNKANIGPFLLLTLLVSNVPLFFISEFDVPGGFFPNAAFRQVLLLGIFAYCCFLGSESILACIRRKT